MMAQNHSTIIENVNTARSAAIFTVIRNVPRSFSGSLDTGRRTLAGRSWLRRTRRIVEGPPLSDAACSRMESIVLNVPFLSAAIDKQERNGRYEGFKLMTLSCTVMYRSCCYRYV
ncbi:hypothetical protein GWI33_015839 [Rhynchophorus ferrugineus]|uniref:Uncharacterized protein n=1 Tax=Rhynchophorus ferrugineus TaxID=354439 RepID=A0A834M411_RHYFE|nr:hypothetical protein GWI33_015839 [Rhynchophorus ferrugineus]